MSVTFDQRKFLGGSTSTPAGVGPGLYDLAAAYDALAASSKNAASSSFLSKSSKNNPRWNYVVGPGAYEASSGFGATVGGTAAFRGPGRAARRSGETRRSAGETTEWVGLGLDSAALRRAAPTAPPPPPHAFEWTRRATAPSIPIATQAWGYEEDASGHLQLQQPAKMRGARLGPGAYRADVRATRPRAPVTDFGAGSGRAQKLIGSTTTAASELQMGGHHNMTSNPLQATPPPSSAFGRVITRAARDAPAAGVHTDSPGPAARPPPPGIGAKVPLGTRHRQRRFSSMALGAMGPRGK